VRAWQALAPDVAREVLELLPADLARHVLTESEPASSVAVLSQLEPEARKQRLATLDKEVARELRDLSAYPEDSAGRLMDARVSPLRSGMTVGEAIERLRAAGHREADLERIHGPIGLPIGAVTPEEIAVAILAEMVQVRRG